MKTKEELNDEELQKVNGGIVLTREQFESGDYFLYGDFTIIFEGDTYQMETEYGDKKVYFYLYKQVGGTKQLLIPRDKF